jgi:hypothetical protein
MAERYPLSWPADFKRTANRRNAQFGKVRTEFNAAKGTHEYAGKRRVSIEDAFDRIERELRALSVDESSVIVSTNLRMNMRGIPSGNQGEPSDPGVAVYWIRKGKPQCMAIDQYTRVADNLAAIAASLEAIRAIERHGGAQIMERAFLGFAALPASSSRPWRDVLMVTHNDVKVDAEWIQTAYRVLAAKHHPDRGGDRAAFEELTQARDAALREIGV